MQSPGLRGRTLSEDQFSCSICLEVFVEPVSTPCGHSFCKACLQGYWDHSKKVVCPMCKKSFSRKPELCVNRVLAEIAEQFQGLTVAPAVCSTDGGAAAAASASPGTPRKDQDGGEFAKPGDVPCDACIGRKMKALKSCLSCPGSFCEAHLRHHRKEKTMAKHKLVQPILHLEEKLCKRHQRLLEAYCCSDHVCVCRECAELAHKTHEITSIDREYKKKMSQVGKRRSEMKHLIKERAKKLEEIKQSIKVIKSNSQREIEESWAVYAELQKLLEQSQAQLVEQITARQKLAEQQARDTAGRLEHELNLLKNRSSDLDALAHTQDKVLFMQHLNSLPPPPEPTDWTGVSVNTDLYLGTIRTSVSTLIERFQEEVKRLYGKELRRMQNYSMDVTLDPDTANPWLQLSEDRRQVRHLGAWQDLPDTPERFDTVVITLAREGFTAGRHYWEVQVGEKDDWYLGVARASVNRKGRIAVSTSQGYWALAMKKGQGYRVSTYPPLLLSVEPRLRRVGVYVDFEEGQLSFYDVATKSHIYTFMDSFGEKVHPFFYLYCCDKASDTLSICPVVENVHSKLC
ncbi:bloodthirsty-related gene family, member 12 [Astyanax mexicanus]|uniref:Bloodthirsty-related gene family, member 12 n=1 Tax=Astyanax mexicanus TaxID=7994 RepID=A0A8T2KTD1_ASTMX|nr:bloodthirsty-related gene family, member 12 [Astyanax mexicanus]